MASESGSLAPVDERALQRFETGWLEGRPEAIEDCLPPADDPRHPATLEELVHIELEMAWKAGAQKGEDNTTWVEAPRVEVYLKRFPLLQQPAIVMRLLRQEFRARHRHGNRPSPNEYRLRFPELIETGTEVETALLDRLPTADFPQTDDDQFPTRVDLRNEVALQIPGYEIVAELGRGGMALVYKARQLALQRLVALKVVAAGRLARPEERARFRCEAEAAASLQHPNVVQIYDVGEHNGWPYLAMELLGGTLAGRSAGRPQPPREAALLIETLARAVHWTHQRGVVHRDLKPANILLAEDGTPKIADFGLARRLAADSGATRTGDLLGTPSYMAPEQADGRARKAGPAADIYSLGAVLYELVTGRPPFRAETALQTAAQVVSKEPVPPRLLEPRVPRDLETICLKCLHKQPTRRYACAADLADDLRHFLNGEPIKGRPVCWGERLFKWARRRPAASLLTVLALTLLTALGVFLALPRNAAAGKPPGSAAGPSFAWDFAAGMPPHGTQQGTEFVQAQCFGDPPFTSGFHLRFRQGGFSQLQFPFAWPEREGPGSRQGGGWKLEVYHLNSRVRRNGPSGYSPVRISLNGQKVWEGDPDGPETPLVPGGVPWKHLVRDVSALVRPEENVLRWDHLHGATTNYWLKSIRLFWDASARKDAGPD